MMSGDDVFKNKRFECVKVMLCCNGATGRMIDTDIFPLNALLKGFLIFPHIMQKAAIFQQVFKRWDSKLLCQISCSFQMLGHSLNGSILAFVRNHFDLIH